MDETLHHPVVHSHPVSAGFPSQTWAYGHWVYIRAGPQSQKWSDQQITLNPTVSIHKKAREKKFDPKKVDFD